VDRTESPRPDGGALARLCRAGEAVALVLLAVMTAFILVQVGARNVLALGLPWAEELARYAGLGVVYLTVPLLLLNDQHIKVELLPSRLHGGVGRVVRLAAELTTLAFGVSLLWGGWFFLQRAARFSTAALGIPNWLYYAPAAIGMTLFTLVALRRVAGALRSNASAPPTPVDAETPR